VIKNVWNKEDFKSISDNGYACLLEIPDNMTFKQIVMLNGAYYPHINEENRTQYNNIRKYTEYKAYGIDVILIILFVLCFFIVYSKRKDFKYLEAAYYDQREKLIKLGQAD